MDHGSSINIVYEHCLKYLLRDIQNYVQPVTSAVVGFAGQSVCLAGSISLPFTLEDYRGNMRKTILT